MAGPRTAGPRPAPTRTHEPSPQTSGGRFAVTSGRIAAPQRIVLYGPGGIGKSSLAALTPNPVVIDIEEGTRELDVQRIEGVADFSALREVLRSDVLDGFATVVIDSATKAEELAIAHTLATVPNEKGHRVTSLEGYGYGKGLTHAYETFLLLIADLDAQIRKGRNVILIAHECVENVPNPVGDDWIRYEPHMQRPKSGKASIRNRVVQWADHVLFVGYDVHSEDGKGRGVGTRTIYPAELPTHVAKSRTLAPDPIPFTGPEDGAVWAAIFDGGAA